MSALLVETHGLLVQCPVRWPLKIVGADDEMGIGRRFVFDFGIWDAEIRNVDSVSSAQVSERPVIWTPKLLTYLQVHSCPPTVNFTDVVAFGLLKSLRSELLNWLAGNGPMPTVD